VVVSQRIKQGTLFMYHAQEKIVNTPGSEKTGNRGGIHNSVTRATLKPTHMIGGYAQLSYGFNYYGTVGSNRDEFVIVRKMKKIDWLDQPVPARNPKWRQRNESSRANRQGSEPRQMHRVSHLLGHLQERLDQPRRREYAWFNNVETKPGTGYPTDWENQKRWNGGWARSASGKLHPKQGSQVADPGEHLRQPRPCPRSTITTSRSISTTTT
jgi:hypothetical protein